MLHQPIPSESGPSIVRHGASLHRIRPGSVDRTVVREARFVTASLRLLSGHAAAETRLADALLGLGAVFGADRVAYLESARGRRIYAVGGPGIPPGEVSALCTWLDRHAEPPGPEVDIAAGSAAVTIVEAAGVTRAMARPVPKPSYAVVPLPGQARGSLALGFRSPRGASLVDARLTESVAWHAAACLSAIARQVDEARELDGLRHLDGARRRFISTVAHELRTPLAALEGYLDLVVQTGVDDPAVRQQFLTRSRDLVDGMSVLVADLLELSRIDSGQVAITPGPFSGADVGQAALDDLMPLASARGIALSGALPSRLRSIHADRRRAAQVLVNLVANAIKFSPPDSRVELSLRYDGLVALYIVRDEGRGITAEERARIFEPFHRSPGTERITGTGLGLSIARELARMMDGDVDVASAAGRGSSFVVALPAVAGVDRSTIRAALDRELVAEELLLLTRTPRP